ncbi:MAG: hypothetical protein JWR53_552, partial [Glaciihabitans sp.]|nr:hypothetical protein [Glaciihabitans sp.]
MSKEPPMPTSDTFNAPLSEVDP